MAKYTSESWPIAAAMLPFAASQDADQETWITQLAEVAFEGFTAVDLTDSWVRIGDMDADRLAQLRDALTATGLEPIAASIIRKSVIDPEHGEENLEYSHRSLDAAAQLEIPTVSFGLHRPLLADQQNVQWFWTEDGPVDDEREETWELAANRLRSLGEHAQSLGIEVSLEMYEDTLIGTVPGTLKLLEKIGLENVGANPDLGNLYRLHREIEDFQDAVVSLSPVTNYWHVKSYYRDVDEKQNLITTVPAPMETGSMNYRTAIKHAVESGFQGAFCVEHYGGDGLSISAMNARYIRKILAVALGEARRLVLKEAKNV